MPRKYGYTKWRSSPYKKYWKRSKPIRYRGYRPNGRRPETKLHLSYYNALGYIYGSLGSTNFGSISDSGLVAELTSMISNGSNVNQRIGGQIFLKTITIQLMMSPGDNNNFVRLILCRPLAGMTAGGANINTSQFFNGYCNGVSTPLNPAVSTQYFIYFDEVVKLEYVAAAGSSSSQTACQQFFKKVVKVNLPIKYDNVSGYTTNPIFFAAISDSSAVAHPGAVAGGISITFHDN